MHPTASLVVEGFMVSLLLATSLLGPAPLEAAVVPRLSSFEATSDGFATGNLSSWPMHMLADILTKSVARPVYRELMRMLDRYSVDGVAGTPATDRGGESSR